MCIDAGEIEDSPSSSPVYEELAWSDCKGAGGVHSYIFLTCTEM